MRVLGVGDSYLIQIHQPLKQLLALEGIEFILDGDPNLSSLDMPGQANVGDTSSMLKRLMSTSFLTKPFDVIYVHVGLHDIKCHPLTKVRQVPIEQFLAHLNELFRFVKRSNLRLLWTTIPKVDDTVHNQLHPVGFHRYNADVILYNHHAKAIAKKCRIPIVDGYKIAFDHSTPDYSDHVHLQPSTAFRYAAGIARSIAAILKEAPQ